MSVPYASMPARHQQTHLNRNYNMSAASRTRLACVGAHSWSDEIPFCVLSTTKTGFFHRIRRHLVVCNRNVYLEHGACHLEDKLHNFGVALVERHKRERMVLWPTLLRSPEWPFFISLVHHCHGATALDILGLRLQLIDVPIFPDHFAVQELCFWL